MELAIESMGDMNVKEELNAYSIIETLDGLHIADPFWAGLDPPHG